MRFDLDFIKEAVPDLSIIQTASLPDYIFSIDTRTLQPGELFIALQGSNVDGHSFIVQAFERGAGGVIINESRKSVLAKLDPALVKDKVLLMVGCTKEALFALAAAWRTKFTIPVMGITGSVGKTSTKELLTTIVNQTSMRCLSSPGTQNTKIGCALTILKLREHHQLAIFEMGINKRGEMAQLAQLVRPTAAVITNIGHSHMEGLGSLHDIALEKRDIFKYFNEDSIGIINGDIPFLSTISYPHPVIKFGFKTINQIQARKVSISAQQTTFVLKLYKHKYSITLTKNHQGAVANALAAAAAAQLLGVPHELIIRGIEQQPTVPGRFEKRMLQKGTGILINDCYNANPESVKAALLAFEKIETSAQKIVILGDMLELGVNSPFWHRQIGRFLRKAPSINHIILVGDLVKWTKKTVPVGMTIDLVPSWKEAVEKLQEKTNHESYVLVKGSLGMKLGNLVEQCSMPGA
jgi:UDP-N-acetylmuramoyl-tripeptide--D-alanyl-D-alanine ligase